MHIMTNTLRRLLILYPSKVEHSKGLWWWIMRSTTALSLSISSTMVSMASYPTWICSTPLLPSPVGKWASGSLSSVCGSMEIATKKDYKQCYAAWPVKDWDMHQALTAVSSLTTSMQSLYKQLGTAGKTKWPWADALKALFGA